MDKLIEELVRVLADVEETERTHTRNAATDRACRLWLADHGRAVLAALRQAAPASLKPLQWRMFCSSGSRLAETPFGAYVVQNEERGWCLYLPHEEDANAVKGSPEEAMAAAMDDYERRARLLMAAPQPDTEGHPARKVTA